MVIIVIIIIIIIIAEHCDPNLAMQWANGCVVCEKNRKMSGPQLSTKYYIVMT